MVTSKEIKHVNNSEAFTLSLNYNALGCCFFSLTDSESKNGSA